MAKSFNVVAGQHGHSGKHCLQLPAAVILLQKVYGPDHM